jgi:serine/threonine-protein kinase
VAVADQDQDIWVWELTRQTLTRFTFDPSQDIYPLWTPDGRRIVFASNPAAAHNLFAQSADGTGEVERLTESPYQQFPYAFSPDGRRLLLRQQNPSTGIDLHILALEGQRANEALLATPFSESNGELSSDGRWLAYQSNESGQDEIYVRPFPDVNAGRWQVSTGGGSRPLWARDGRELFYLAGDGRLTGVAVETSNSTFTTGNPVRLLERAYLSPAPGRTYDVSPDGQRFLMIKEVGSDEGGATSELVVVLNWFEELKRLVPAGGRGR